MLPATISVAPNSPSALAKANTVPAAIPGQAKCKEIVQNIFHSDIPKVLAALSMFLSICSKAPFEVLYISGKDTTTAAITVADQEKIIFISIRESSFPTGPFFPNISNRMKPSTVGGSTIGSVNKASIRLP
jgi:hypothetical protein